MFLSWELQFLEIMRKGQTLYVFFVKGNDFWGDGEGQNLTYCLTQMYHTAICLVYKLQFLTWLPILSNATITENWLNNILNKKQHLVT